MEAKGKIEAWREDYNVSRPHMSLGYVMPIEFANHDLKISPVGSNLNKPELTLGLCQKWGDFH